MPQTSQSKKVNRVKKRIGNTTTKGKTTRKAKPSAKVRRMGSKGVKVKLKF